MSNRQFPIIRGAGVVLLATALFAGTTRTWRQGEFPDYDKAVIRNLSLRSDGLLGLAPRSQEMFDTASAYLWALALDSKGNLYAGGGTGAKLFVIPQGGKGRMLAELDALEIHAIAVDSRDRVYAGTSPDGKIYRITGNNKPEIFYDPKSKYIWALAFARNGDLLIATGDQGEIHRVSPDGKGRVFFKSDETHVRSLAIDGNGDLVVGTDPRGLVLRISQGGDGFVLYQMPKREVTAVAVARDGAIYASAVGNKPASPAPAPPAPPSPPAPPPGGPSGPGMPVGAAAAARPSAAPPPASAAPAGVSGGSEVYRIEPNGNPRRVWYHAQDVVYAITFDSSGRAIIGAGNKGRVYRIESPTVYTSLLALPVTQITAFQTGSGGRLYAAAGNVGKVYEIGPGLEREGSVESDVFDAGSYTQWGRLSFEARLNEGRVAIATRSGNLDQPQNNWSAWSTPFTATQGGRVASPAARFVQWKATLTGDGGVHSPELESVDVAYLPKNVEPHVDDIEITSANYRFPAPSTGSGGTQTLNLPPMGRRNAQMPPAFGIEPVTTTPSMLYAKGHIGARWLAADPNGDAMVYNIEIRGLNETEWKPLKEKVAEKYLSWDSTAFTDGEYRIRITASDAPGNPPAEALLSRTESAPFLIDNTPPRITALSASRAGGKLQVRWHAADALSIVGKAEYSLDGGEWTVVAPVTRLSDSLELDYDLNLDVSPGEHTVAVRVQDDYENQATDKVVVRP